MGQDDRDGEYGWIPRANVDRLREKLAQTQDPEERKVIQRVLDDELKNLHDQRP